MKKHLVTDLFVLCLFLWTQHWFSAESKDKWWFFWCILNDQNSECSFGRSVSFCTLWAFQVKSDVLGSLSTVIPSLQLRPALWKQTVNISVPPHWRRNRAAADRRSFREEKDTITLRNNDRVNQSGLTCSRWLDCAWTCSSPPDHHNLQFIFQVPVIFTKLWIWSSVLFSNSREKRFQSKQTQVQMLNEKINKHNNVYTMLLDHVSIFWWGEVCTFTLCKPVKIILIIFIYLTCGNGNTGGLGAWVNVNLPGESTSQGCTNPF